MQQQSWPNALQDQAQRQLEQYWQLRIAKSLEYLEGEVRRMLRVESSLERFASDMVTRLHAYRDTLRHLPPEIVEPLTLPNAPFDWVAQEVGVARAREMKARYRRLAKEVHPDFSAAGEGRATMAAVNHAYATDDLAALVRLEAAELAPREGSNAAQYEDYMRQVEQATQTYRSAYTQLLNSPLYSLYARAASALEDGWDFVDSLARRLQRAIENRAMEAA